MLNELFSFRTRRVKMREEMFAKSRLSRTRHEWQECRRPNSRYRAASQTAAELWGLLPRAALADSLALGYYRSPFQGFQLAASQIVGIMVRRKFICLICLFFVHFLIAPKALADFSPGAVWRDVDGNSIQAHG